MPPGRARQDKDIPTHFNQGTHMASTNGHRQNPNQHRFGNLLTEDLKDILEQGFQDLLAIFVACMEPEEVRDQKANWIATTLHDLISELQKAVEKMGYNSRPNP